MTASAVSGVSADVQDDVLVCTINRPDRANTLRAQDCVELAAAIEAAGRGGVVRAVLLRGEGRHFCAGADLAGNRTAAGEQKPAIGSLSHRLAGSFHRLIEVLWDCPLPIVAAAQGRSAGFGLHLALTADFVVAAEGATFAEPFAERGFSSDSGGTYLLPRLIGLARATELLLLGDAIDVATAQSWGLITRVVRDENLDAEAAALATRLSRAATYALARIKSNLHRHATGGTLSDALRSEEASVELTVRTDDFKAGMRAFAEKQPPLFRGR